MSTLAGARPAAAAPGRTFDELVRSTPCDPGVLWSALVDEVALGRVSFDGVRFTATPEGVAAFWPLRYLKPDWRT